MGSLLFVWRLFYVNGVWNISPGRSDSAELKRDFQGCSFESSSLFLHQTETRQINHEGYWVLCWDVQKYLTFQTETCWQSYSMMRVFSLNNKVTGEWVIPPLQLWMFGFCCLHQRLVVLSTFLASHSVIHPSFNIFGGRARRVLATSGTWLDPSGE